jgi:hypothetical protein
MMLQYIKAGLMTLPLSRKDNTFYYPPAVIVSYPKKKGIMINSMAFSPTRFAHNLIANPTH